MDFEHEITSFLAKLELVKKWFLIEYSLIFQREKLTKNTMNIAPMLKSCKVQKIKRNLLYETASFKSAAKIYLDLRKKGKTVRSTIDIIIAETAIANGLYLLHNDYDFDIISENINELKIYQ